MNLQRLEWMCVGMVFCVALVGRVSVAAEADSSPVVTKVASFDGTEIYCESRGDGETALLFLHGWCGTHDYWKHQVDAFAKDYRVVTIDQAGHGASGKDRKEWTIDSLAADVAAVVDALKLKRVVLVGHSMGGPVSMAAAPKLPGTVVGIVGVDTLHNVEFRWNPEEANGFLAGLKNDFPGTLRAGLKGLNRDDVDPALLESLTADALERDPVMALGLMTDMTGLDESKLMSAVKAPIRCINAAPSFAYALPTQVETNRKYADYDAVIMEGVGHYPMLETPEEFNSRLAEVLQGFAAK